MQKHRFTNTGNAQHFTEHIAATTNIGIGQTSTKTCTRSPGRRR